MSDSTSRPVPSGLDESLRAAEQAILCGDKQAASSALFHAELALGSGPHPLRRQIRAASCALDISNWALAHANITSVMDGESARSFG